MEWRFQLAAQPYGGITEGPVWDGEAILFTHIPASRIMRYDPDTGDITQWRDGTNHTNGWVHDAQGNLFGCCSGGRSIVRFNPDGTTTTVTDRVDGDEALARALGLDDGRPPWVCGSTGPGEDAMVLDAYRNLAKRRGEAAREAVDVEAKSGAASALRLAIVPRKPERFDEVARIIERSGFVCIRRTTHPDDTPVEKLPDAAVILGDTMGELRKFYALADVVFVGRSLVPMGGSDPMEAAALGKPIVVGRHTDNFREPIEALLEADAVRIAEEPSDLADIVLAMLLDNSLADGLRARAKQVVLDHQGATDRTADRLVELFEEHAPATGDPAGGGRTECAASVPVERNLY